MEKKTLIIKKEPCEEDMIELIKKLYPNDLKKLYLVSVGMLASVGYEIIYD